MRNDNARALLPSIDAAHQEKNNDETAKIKNSKAPAVTREADGGATNNAAKTTIKTRKKKRPLVKRP